VASQDATAVESLLERARELLSEEGALGTANALVNQALSLRPDSVTAWVVKCQICSAQGDDFSALAAIEMAVRRAPQRAEALYWRGAVLGDLGRNREALRALDRAFAAGTPDDAWLLEDLFYEKACVLDAMDLRAEAQRTLREGLLRCPSSSLLRLALGGGRTSRSRSLADSDDELADLDAPELADPPEGADALEHIEEPVEEPRRRPMLKLLRGGMP
jgi:tetratricopeptide (TPR) repeat protein